MTVRSAEYPTVLAGSRDREALLAAHATPITIEKAREIVYSYLDGEEAEVRFTATTMRGRAWENGALRLPDSPTLGLTLHEIAHVLVFHDRADGHDVHHGPAFIKILDDLVRSERLWAEGKGQGCWPVQ